MEPPFSDFTENKRLYHASGHNVAEMKQLCFQYHGKNKTGTTTSGVNLPSFVTMRLVIGVEPLPASPQVLETTGR